MSGWLIAITVSAIALALHLLLFALFRRWVWRDLALSLAGDDPHKRAWMLAQLQAARRQRVPRRQLEAWLTAAAARYPSQAPPPR